MVLSSSTPPCPQSLYGCNASSLQGRGGVLMSYTEAKVLRRAYIITGIYSLSIFSPTFITSYRLSCNAVILCYYCNSAPLYLGFNTEQQAWTFFQHSRLADNCLLDFFQLHSDLSIIHLYPNKCFLSLFIQSCKVI